MNRKTLAVGGAAAVVIVLAWYLLMWSPAGHKLTAARAATAKDVATQAALESRLSGLVVINRSLPAKESELAALAPSLPAKVAADTIIDQINAAALANSVDWTNESQSVTTPAAGATSTSPTQSSSSSGAASGAPTASVLSVSLTVSGSYQHLSSFITAVQHLPRLLVLDSVNLAPTQSGPGALTATLVGRAFFDPPSTGAATSSTAAAAG